LTQGKATSEEALNTESSLQDPCGDVCMGSNRRLYWGKRNQNNKQEQTTKKKKEEGFYDQKQKPINTSLGKISIRFFPRLFGGSSHPLCFES
jgi:hypothetical protein